ncbi:MAG: xanthine dehydrogenase family protein subunit M [Desulfobacterales bacterium]|nr:xanthine dehydrogenase family protein subunit M [Desulfobacterales bacterium]
MKPTKFDYYAPSSLEEAFGLLEKYGDDAKILAGGQSLMPLMNMRLATPKVLVDINRIPGLDYIREENGQVAIGAMTRHRTVETSALLGASCPLLPAVAKDVAHVQVRNRGTFGGSVTHGDPAAEFPAVLATLGGTIVCTGPGAVREVFSDEFYLGMLTTCLEPDEIVTEVKLPNLVGRKWAHRSIMRTHGDFAIAGIMAALSLDPGGQCRDVHVGMYGVGPLPVRSAEAEAIIEGRQITDELLQEAARAAADEAQPESDLRGTEAYRRKLIRVLLPLCLREAVNQSN